MDLADVVAVVSRVDLFQGVSDLHDLVRDCARLSLTDRDVVFEYGDSGASMFVVLDGQIQICRNERIINVLGPGEYLGELALIEFGKRSASARSLGPSTLLEISQEQFDRYVRSRPEAMLAVLRKVGRRLRGSLDSTQAAYEHLNMAVHDMLNLTTILEGAEIVKDLLPEDHDAQPFLDSILAAQEKLQTMMRTALRTFRGISVPYEKKPEAIDDLVRECVREDLAMHPDVRRARVQIDDPAAPKPVRCNSLDIRRVVGNLVINAAQSTPGDVAIRIGVTQGGGRTVISVADDGPGIPEQIRRRVFESHFTTKANGNGIGLSSCREIVELLHGGRLTFESEVGRGTTFFCELPD